MISSTAKQINTKSPIREQTSQWLTVRMRPKHPSSKIDQPTLLATKNYVALSSPSHLEIRRSEIHISSNTIIKNTKNIFCLVQNYVALNSYLRIRMSKTHNLIKHALTKTLLRPFLFSFTLLIYLKKTNNIS